MDQALTVPIFGEINTKVGKIEANKQVTNSKLHGSTHFKTFPTKTKGKEKKTHFNT